MHLPITQTKYVSPCWKVSPVSFVQVFLPWLDTSRTENTFFLSSSDIAPPEIQKSTHSMNETFHFIKQSLFPFLQVHKCHTCPNNCIVCSTSSPAAILQSCLCTDILHNSQVQNQRIGALTVDSGLVINTFQFLCDFYIEIFNNQDTIHAILDIIS